MLYERLRELSAPANVHIEFVSSCNEKCRHCYNFWREESAPANMITRENLDNILDQLQSSGIFHVIMTGGEPLINYPMVLYGAKRLQEMKMSTSLNSNLMLATYEKMKALKDAGLPHVLTSVISHDPEVHDFIGTTQGAWKKIVKGIEATLKAGIKVTNNMVISQRNKHHIYDTGKFLHSIGVSAICATRVSPPSYADINMRTELQVSVDDAQLMLDQLMRLKEEFGMQISSLIPFPLCFLRDFEKYADFAGRKCAAGTYTISLNSNGDAHACQKEGFDSGNILRDGLAGVWQKVQPWRTEAQMPEPCKTCAALPECGGGCRVVGYGYGGSLAGKDNLALDPITEADVTITAEMWQQIDTGRLHVSSGLRFRQEKGFTLLNITGAKNMMIEDFIADILKEKMASGDAFTLQDVGEDNRRTFAHLLKKGAVRSVSSVPAYA